MLSRIIQKHYREHIFGPQNAKSYRGLTSVKLEVRNHRAISAVEKSYIGKMQPVSDTCARAYAHALKFISLNFVTIWNKNFLDSTTADLIFNK